MIYVVDGGLDVTSDGTRTSVKSGSAWHRATPCAMVAGPRGARVLRFELGAGT